MNDVYYVIDTLRKHKYLSVRKLAELAKINPSSLATMMDRRPKTISRKNLEAIGGVLGARWNDLVNLPEGSYPADARIPAALSEDEINFILHNLIGNEEIMCSSRDGDEEHRATGMLAERKNQECDAALFGSQHNKEDEWQRSHDEQYKRSIICMLDMLNTDGLLEAMQRVLAVTRQAEFCKQASKPKTKEDNEWQEKGQ